MKYTLSVIFLVLTSLHIGFSQTPTDDDDDVVKISTKLVQIDVSVTDKKGNAVTDLKPEDFELFENGIKQKITNFSFVANNLSSKLGEAESKKKSVDNSPAE